MATARSVDVEAPSLCHRAILHIDLDAFYCQVETLRLGLDPAIPMAVLQWHGLIAVNYAARAAGITRHMRVEEARRVCPALVTVHVETLDLEGRRRTDSATTRPDQGTEKVSLQRYRLASGAIFKLLVRIFGEARVEKSSVDEAYIDVTAMVDALLVRGAVKEAGAGGPAGATGPRISAGGREEEEGEQGEGEAPPSATKAGSKRPRDLTDGGSPMGQRAVDDQLSREDTFVVGSDRGETMGARLDASQLSDVRIAAVGVIAAYTRTRVLEELGYTCSAGVAHCKMLAKLASARNKPKKQTLVPARCVGALLATLPVQRIRFLGSKLGRQLCAETIAAGLVPAQGGAGAAPPAAAPSDAREEEGGEEEDGEDGRAEEEEGEEEGEGEAGAGAGAPRARGAHDPLERVTAGQAQGLSLSHLRRVFGDAQGGVLHALVRGVDESAIVPKVRPKGMMAAKSVSAGACATFPAAVKWLRMLSFELADRLAADDAAWQRIPKTFTLHFKREGTGESRSRSGPMPAKPHTQEAILDAGTVLLRRAMEDERPSSSSSADPPFASVTFLSLGVSNFVEYGGTGGLDAFFKPGPDRTSSGSAASASSGGAASRKAPAPRGIAAFLLRPAAAAVAQKAPGDAEAVIVLDDEEEEAAGGAGGAGEGEAPAPPRGSVCPICGQTIEGASAAGPRARDEAVNRHVDACLRRPR